MEGDDQKQCHKGNHPNAEHPHIVADEIHHVSHNHGHPSQVHFGTIPVPVQYGTDVGDIRLLLCHQSSAVTLELIGDTFEFLSLLGCQLCLQQFLAQTISALAQVLVGPVATEIHL